MKTYPAITFVARYGRRSALPIGVLVMLIRIASTMSEGGLMPMVHALIAGAATWAVARLLAELIEVIADTLLPR